MDNDFERSYGGLEDSVSYTSMGLFKVPQNRQLDYSITMQPDEIQKILDMSKIDQTNRLFENERTFTGSTIIQQTVPTSENLCTEFFETSLNHSGEVLEIVCDFSRCCSDTIESSNTTVANIEELKNERDTWKLLFILYQDRLASSSLLNSHDAILMESYMGLSEKICVQKLFKRDNLIREIQLVIDWLENCASEQELFLDFTVGWENTLHQIKSAETIAFSSTRKVVNKLDPDAPNYQKLPLHDLDLEDEKQLCKSVFHKIRCGKLEEAQEICLASGHAWRASMLEGWKLFHDPNIELDEKMDLDELDGCETPQSPLNDGEYFETEGNPSRDIWKLMAIEYCQKPYLKIEEKAAIAAYSGSLSPLLNICKTWHDYLWAYLRTIVDVRVESEIRDNLNREYLPLPDWYWDQRMSLNEIFKKLENLCSESNEHVLIQKFVILDDVNTLMKVLEELVENPKATTNFLRFSTHFVLFLDQIGQINNKNIVEISVENYVKRLEKMGETRIIAFYLSKVSEKRQVNLYASHLMKIMDNEERKLALSYAEDFGLDPLEITKKIVENIRSKIDELELSNLISKITENDLYKISSVDWLIFYEQQRAELIFQSNAIIFTFLTMSKLDGAQLVFNKIPSDTVEKLLRENTNERLENSLKEHLSYKVYLEAHEGFNEWFQKFKSKPQPPEIVSKTAAFTEKVAYQHRVTQYENELERWKTTVGHLGKSAKKLLYNVLLFPDTWLSTAKDGAYLRSICIPKIVLLLCTLLSESEEHLECVQLADILASEKYGLYKVYSKDKLGELLSKLCESFKILLNIKEDSWHQESLPMSL